MQAVIARYCVHISISNLEPQYTSTINGTTGVTFSVVQVSIPDHPYPGVLVHQFTISREIVIVVLFFEFQRPNLIKTRNHLRAT